MTAPWAVWLNEVRIASATPDVFTWWLPYRTRFEHSGQVHILTVTLPGEEIELGPYPDRGDADFISAHLIQQGVPASAVKVRPWRPERQAIT
ncbi:hypothetical protein [Nonomuraea endophytica]|uniref:hypothetical protein n=1 Tax=Nonomuraea endophytica TaxID=714136 RepID=UPI0037C6E4D6